ncbi:MAG TPA: DPP IV N-terminal domain-containing protein, partial [Terriglobales bacterium]
VGSEDAFHPAVSRQGNHLAYAQSSASWSIMRVSLAAKETVTRLWSSTQEDSAPRFSPDGKRIAFQSWRSGTQEIWVAQADGSGPEKLTSFEASLTGSPDWSPDGKQIAFDSRPDGRSHIYVITVEGGKPQPMTQGDNNDIVPSWSRDGRWIYFGSNRGGAWQIWKVAGTGGEPVQVTHQGGFVGAESFDGKWLYFAKADEAGLWRMPTSGGEETKVLDQPRASYWGYWTVGREGVYYLNMQTTPPQIELLPTTGGRPARVYTMKRFPPLYAGLTISPDARTLLYNELTESGSHITLAERER